MNCQRLRDSSTDALSGTLPATEAAAIQTHLAVAVLTIGLVLGARLVPPPAPARVFEDLVRTSSVDEAVRNAAQTALAML